MAPSKRACVDQQVTMESDGRSWDQPERGCPDGPGSAPLIISNIMSGKATPSAGVLKKLHGVLFKPSKEERVVPAEVKVLAWKKGDRHGVVVHGAGGGAGQVGEGAIRVGGRVPWGAEVEYAYRAGYDSRGRVSVTPVVAPGYSCMLTQPEPDGA